MRSALINKNQVDESSSSEKTARRERMCLLNVLKRDPLSSTCQVLLIFICLDRIHIQASTFPILWCCLCKSVWTELWTDESCFRQYKAVHSKRPSLVFDKWGSTKLEFTLFCGGGLETSLYKCTEPYDFK